MDEAVKVIPKLRMLRGCMIKTLEAKSNAL
jgi:hypothetical protein